MKAPWSEKVRFLLANSVLTSYYGMTLGEYLGLLRNHDFSIDPACWPRAAFMLGAALLNSFIHRREDRVFGSRVRDVEIKQPLFIVGHWRSGTTHLQNLLAVDKQFAYPNVYQALNPHTFLSTERFARFLSFIPPKTRIVDNLSFGFETPFEDEFSTVGSLASPILWWVFPRGENHYLKYLTFREAPPEEVDRWKEALLQFYKKLAWKYDRPLIFKSPPHTGRIKLLLEMFPDARFVHIYRNPYMVFQSTKLQNLRMLRVSRLQNIDVKELDGIIIQRYNEMYDVFFEERGLIPDCRYHEVRYEDLEGDAVGQIRQIYEKLDLPGFGAFQPSLRRYVDSTANYRKNKYSELPEPLRNEIAQCWRKNFEMWGYAHQ
jgi:hypothetical protein